MSNDLTGRDRLAKNVSASYLSHLVFIIFGFLLPRMISDKVGQTGLGIWDFSWAFVKYMNLSMIGIGSSVNRFVARYRAADDQAAMNRTVSTVIAVQLSIAAAVFFATVMLAYYIPIWFAARLGDEGETARWVVAFLGFSLAVQMAFDAWRGVLTGYHRWDYYNGINAGSHAVVSTAMLATLLLGYGLVEMALVYLGGTLLTEILRYKIARAICPELVIRAALVNLKDAKKVVRFGGKTILLGMPGIIATHTINIFIVAKLGPAALAIMARPAALIVTITTLLAKYANVLVPTAGSLQSQGNLVELREFALSSSRTNLILAVPPVAFLLIMGDVVVSLWMGPSYANWQISAILAGAAILPLSQAAMMRILIGMDMHGRVAKNAALATISLLVIGLLITQFTGWSLPIAAALSAIPAGTSVGLTVLYFAFKKLDLTSTEYFKNVLQDGLVLLIVSCACMFAFRYYTDFNTLLTLLGGMAISGIVTLALHYRDLKRLYRAIKG